MKKIDFNQGWYFKRLGEKESERPISIPHDAMCQEKRSAESKGRHNIGWFESYDYVYRKEYFVSAELEGSSILLEFEGVYHEAEVFVNGIKAAYRPYGYTSFFVNISKYLKYGEKNEVSVIARNSNQPNSRWYTGSGIYRPVWMYIAKGQYILANGVKIKTVDCQSKDGMPAQMGAEIHTVFPGMVEVEILDQTGSYVYSGKKETCQQKKHAKTVIEIEIPEAKLWSPQSPYLYTCVVRCGDDEARETFGIRKLEWSAKQGLCINGKRVILKGACIHHDNGLLGACAFSEAEERKIKLLQEVGYNAIRSAHNPCSKALLDACDRLGMLVMDEYVDMWYIHKNQYDYATHMQEWWKKDLRDMVKKDYNHPSVILYSIGNEVAETGEKRGIKLTGEMTEYLHMLDETRPVSCGINIFFNFLYSMGFGVYSDEKAKKESENKKKSAVGSEFYNTLAGMLGDKTMKIGATLHMCDVKTRDAYANMDIAGYNYGIFRYKHDLKKYPERLILGSETFCKDAYDFYELAKKEPRIIGDFVWAGMDYMGEAGIGAWEYEDYAPKNATECGWLTAGSGRLNILGFANGEAAYTKVALEKEAGPYIAVRPVYQRGKHSPSAWKMTDAMESWSWPGCEGYQAVVEVYARAAIVEILLNGRDVGRKKIKKGCNVSFTVPYEEGELTAIVYDENEREMGRRSLVSAGKPTMLNLNAEKNILNKNGLGYIRIRYTDDKGIWKPMEKHNLKISVENGELLGFGNACSYNKDGYWKNTTKTYYGEAMAVVRAKEEGSIRVKVSDEKQTYELELPIIDDEAGE